MLRPTDVYIAALLERGIRVLIYTGTNDWACNWFGSSKWTTNLEWSQREDFRRQSLRSWTVSGKGAGLARAACGLTYATIFGSGHMVRWCCYAVHYLLTTVLGAIRQTCGIARALQKVVEE